MRDHRHILVECYLAQFAPPSLRQVWQQREKRHLRREGVWQRYWLLAVVMGPAILLQLTCQVADLGSELRTAWIKAVADALLAIAVVLMIVHMWRDRFRHNRHQARQARRWRTRGFFLVPRGATPGSDERHCVASELEQRHGVWRSRVRQASDLKLLGSVMMYLDTVTGILYTAWMAMGWLCWIGPDSVFRPTSGSNVLISLLAVLSPAVFVSAAIRMRKLRRWFPRAWEEKFCPACGYGLAYCDDPAEPHRCPECAFPWPLVPPPADKREGMQADTVESSNA